MASFVKFIEDFDAKRGIPRPADSPHLPAFHAFLRISRHVGLGLVLFTCGCISSYLLWRCADWLEVTAYTRLFFVIGMLLCLMVSFFEIAHEVLPYYRIKQRLTFGTARWADEPYLKGVGLALKVAPDLSNLPKGAIRVAKLHRGYDLVLPIKEWLRHLAIFGPPGSGKSKTFLMTMLRDLARGGSAIILDPKGELYEQTAGSFRQVYRLDLLNPHKSDRWNFLPQCKNDHEFASQMAATMIGLEGTKYAFSDPFWQESSLLLLTTVLLHLSDVVANPTPPMVFEYLGMRDMAAIDTEMTNTKNTAVRLNWGAFKKGSEGTKGNVITSLMNKLAPFEIQHAQAVCAPITDADRAAGVRLIDFKKLRTPGTAIYVVVAEGDATRYKNVLSTFFGQAVNELRLSQDGSSDEDDVTPVAFCLDEAANVPITGLKEFAGVGRGRRMGLWLGYQNMPQTQDQYNHDGANAILGAIGCTLFLPGLDDATTQFASRRIGQATVWSHTTIDAKGKKNDSERQSETGRALMDPTEVRQMVKHKQCVFIVDTSPPIRATYPPLVLNPFKAKAPVYGKPKLVSLIDAEEEMIEVAAQQYREKRLAEAVARMERGELLDDQAQTAGTPEGLAERDAVAPDEVYQTIYLRLSEGELPEPAPESRQSPFAKIVKARYDSGQISKWEDLRDLDIKVMKRLGLIKRGLSVSGEVLDPVNLVGAQTVGVVASAAPVVGQPIGTVVAVGSSGGVAQSVSAAAPVTGPPAASLSETSKAQTGVSTAGKKANPNQHVLFMLTDEVVERTVVDAGRLQITNRVRSDGGKRAVITPSVDSFRGGPKVPVGAMESRPATVPQDSLR
jgi:type IV secretion system protein VirD4